MPFLAILASLFKAIANIAEKQVLTKEDVEIYSSQLSFVLAFISLPLLFFVKNFDLSSTTLLIIYATSIGSIVAALISVWIIKKLDLSESAVLFAASPIFVAVFAIFFLNETLSNLAIIGIVISCLGIFILEYHSPKKEKHPLGVHGTTSALPELPAELAGPKKKPLLFVLLFVSLICFSASAIADRYVIHSRGMDPLLYLLVIQFCILFNFALIDLFINKKMKRKVINPQLFLRKSFWTNIIFILCHRVAHVFALQFMQISILNAVKQIAAVFTTIFGGSIFKEKHILKRSIACVVVVAGVVLVILG